MIYRGKHYLEETVPGKTNNSSSGESFYQTFVYERFLPDHRPFFADHQGTIHSLYGKVDTSGYVIYPKERFLKKISISSEEGLEEEEHYCLSLTKTCFMEFLTYYNRLRQRGKVREENSVLSEIKIARSWYDPVPEYYQSFMQPVKEFNRFNSKNKNIIEYKHYENSYVRQLEKRASSNGSVTMSETHLSSSPLATGLFLEVYEGLYSEDASKVLEFISDVNFEVFRKSIKRFGFKLDKNIPWRVFIDFSSPYIQYKMAQAGFRNLSEFFSFYYDKVCIRECSELKSNMRDAYSSFYGQYPDVNYFSVCGTETQQRQPYSSTNILDKDYLKMYIHLRAREVGKTWSQNKIDSVISNVLHVEKIRGLNSAVLRAESFFLDRSYDTFQKNRLTNRNNFDRFVGSSTRSSSSATMRTAFNYASSNSGSGGSYSGY